MCTAIAMPNGDCFFGRTLDLEYHYNETVTLSPRNFPFWSPSGSQVLGKYAIIGMATVVEDYPLYYDGMNEHGLCMAGLHFPGNGVYLEPTEGVENLPPYALIPRVLSSCASLTEAKALLTEIRLVDRPFSTEYSLTPLHWMISMKGESIVVEPMADGLKVYENPMSVMTNNPTFPAQMAGTPRYNGLRADEPTDWLVDPSLLPASYRGLGAVGLPGDYSSHARFVRGVFLRENTPPLAEKDGVIGFFRMMEAVSIPRGVIRTKDGRLVHTIYTSCCDPKNLTYYYTTYDHPSVTGVRLSEAVMNGTNLIRYSLQWNGEIEWV